MLSREREFLIRLVNVVLLALWPIRRRYEVGIPSSTGSSFNGALM
jgi:hypothetical protein